MVNRPDQPTTLFIDDGTGYEEISTGVANETLMDSALGGEAPALYDISSISNSDLKRIIPIAIVANAARVTLTGILSQYKPELAHGFFHSASGWVIFMVALLILAVFHQIAARGLKLLHAD